VTGAMDPDSRKGFPWDSARWEADLLDATRGAIALRHAEPALRADGVEVITAAGDALAFERRAGDRRLGVAINAGDARASLGLGPAAADAAVLLAMGRGRTSPLRLDVRDGAAAIELPPRSGAVISLS
jgi:cyclomaltodextrinase / maltogenic alpha-amylase / neopullulanase